MGGLPVVLVLALVRPATQEPDNPLLAATRARKKDVVRLRGLEFTREVEVGVYTKAELRSFLAEELARELPPRKAAQWQKAYATFGLIPKDMDLTEALMSLYGGSIAGFYHPETKELRLIRPEKPDPDEEELRKSGIDLEAITLVHELTHAAQDQRYEISTLPLDDETNDDLVMALKGVIEGDASVVGFKYGFPDRYLKILPGYNAMLKRGDLPGDANALPRYLRQTLTFPYGHGTDFVLAYLKAVDGDLPDASALLEDWPLSTEQILHPLKYLSKKDRDNPTLVKLEGTARILGAPWKETVNNVHGEFGIGILLGEFLKGPLEEERVKDASEGWDGDRYVVLENGDGGVLYAWYSTWDTEDDARQFLEAYRSVLQERYAPAKVASAPSRTVIAAAGARYASLERRGRDVLVLDGAPKPLLEKTGALWKAATKSEMTKVVRLEKFVCAPCGVKKAFSGDCPDCGKALVYQAKKRGPREYEIRGRASGVGR